MEPPIVKAVENGVEVALWVVPGATRTEVLGRHGNAVRVRVAQPAESGRANEAVVAALERTLDAKVSLVAGFTHRRKRVLVKGRSVIEVRRGLGL